MLTFDQTQMNETSCFQYTSRILWSLGAATFSIGFLSLMFKVSRDFIVVVCVFVSQSWERLRGLNLGDLQMAHGGGVFLRS